MNRGANHPYQAPTGRQPHENSRLSEPREGDGAYSSWSREALIAMDEKFTRAMRKAIESGTEQPHGAETMPMRRAG